MAAYAYNKCEYYLQLEDDITTVPGYLTDIDNYINSIKEQWVLLEFSKLGFIGKLFANYDLPRMATLFRVFYEDHPVDFLLRWFVALSGLDHTKAYVRKPTLFQHGGTYSSLKGKKQLLKDPDVAQAKAPGVEVPKAVQGDQPPADVTSSMDVYESNFLDRAYSNSPGITWLISPRKDDHYTVTFKTPQKLKKVLIMSGAPVGYKGVGDTFQGVELQGCSADGSCTTLIANTQERDLVKEFTPSEGKLQSLRLVITENYRGWLILRQFVVHTA